MQQHSPGVFFCDRLMHSDGLLFAFKQLRQPRIRHMENQTVTTVISGSIL